jgi:hypothetical protein
VRCGRSGSVRVTLPRCCDGDREQDQEGGEKQAELLKETWTSSRQAVLRQLSMVDNPAKRQRVVSRIAQLDKVSDCHHAVALVFMPLLSASVAS